MCAAEDKNEFLRRSHSPFVVFQADLTSLPQAHLRFEETCCKSRTLSNFFHRLPCQQINAVIMYLYSINLQHTESLFLRYKRHIRT